MIQGISYVILAATPLRAAGMLAFTVFVVLCLVVALQWWRLHR
jgi:hypothetical protein